MSEQTLSEEWLEIGIIVAPQGLQGEVRVLSSSDFPERFTQKGTRWLQSPKGETPQAVKLSSGRYLDGKNLYIVKLAEIQNRTQAESLRHYRLLVPASDRLPVEDDEYHVADLIGLEVYDQQTGELIGIVKDVFSAGNDLLEVQLTPEFMSKKSTKEQEEIETQKVSGKRILVPFVKAIVPIVEINNKRIEINPPTGLLDL
ncbi:MAG: ribosome maturation factor RimM [Snowella sp.]|nr:ribosome maturation factor RimM [Snowella sp.]